MKREKKKKKTVLKGEKEEKKMFFKTISARECMDRSWSIVVM